MREPSRKERERDRHRQELLEAAEALFAERGFHQTTVQEIAQRAEFAVGTIYNFFEGKTAIYHELVHMRARQYVARVRRSLSRLEGAREKIRALIATKLEFFEDNEQFFRIFTRTTSGQDRERPSGVPLQARKIYSDYTTMVSDVFAEGIHEGIFVDVPAIVLTLLLEGATNSIIAHSIHTGGEKLPGVSAGIIEELLFHGLLAGERRPS